ncbi:hypothetical protein PR048_002641 [Dryococelus australis]|uniref:Uncharacterized protein n=1 Tax=Dryococelus australis TaxID=614101 RepID=A0ABQ9IM87_9NEOP|nr:hypothetical protein PR048_002641 [Dryococelus australis]
MTRTERRVFRGGARRWPSSLNGYMQYKAAAARDAELVHNTTSKGAAVAERLACSPPAPQANRARSPAGSHPGFSQVAIVPDDATGRWVFSGISRFPTLSLRRCSIFASFHSHRLSRARRMIKAHHNRGSLGEENFNPSPFLLKTFGYAHEMKLGSNEKTALSKRNTSRTFKLITFGDTSRCVIAEPPNAILWHIIPLLLQLPL